MQTSEFFIISIFISFPFLTSLLSNIKCFARKDDIKDRISFTKSQSSIIRDMTQMLGRVK